MFQNSLLSHISIYTTCARAYIGYHACISGISIGEKQYESCLEHREFWDNLTNIRFSDVNDIILPFLNKWQCRLPYECAKGLTTALQQSEILLKPLRSFKIQSADLLQQVLVQRRKMKILILLQDIFDVISKVKAGRRTVAFTATSKILHMAVPDFFVMADETIRKKYGCEGNGAGYANFMWRIIAWVFQIAISCHNTLTS